LPRAGLAAPVVKIACLLKGPGLAFLPPGRTGALRGPVSSIGTRLSRAASSLKP